MAKVKSKANNLVFDDGFKSFTINGDPARTIRFNPADPGIVTRLLDLQKKMASYQPEQDIEVNPDGTPKSEIEQAATIIAEFSNVIRTALNETFDADVYDTIFGKQSPLCVVGPKGGEKHLFEAVIDGLVEIMQPAFEEYARINNSKMQKYMGGM